MSRFYKEINENVQDETSELSIDDKTKELLSELRVDNIEELTEDDLKETLEFIKQNNLDTKEKIVDFLYDNMQNQYEPSVEGEIHKSGVGRNILIGMLGVISFTGGMGQGIKDSVDQRHQMEALIPQYVQEQTISVDDNRYNINGINEAILTVAQNNESGLIDWNEVQLGDVLSGISSGIEALEPFAPKDNEYENLLDQPEEVVACGAGPGGDDPNELESLLTTPYTYTSEDVIPEESVVETSDDVVPEESVVETSDDIVPEESAVETSDDVVPEESVVETSDDIVPEETVVETSDDVVPEESVVETSDDVVSEETVVETSDDVVPEETVVETSDDIAPEESVVEISSDSFEE